MDNVKEDGKTSCGHSIQWIKVLGELVCHWLHCQMAAAAESNAWNQLARLFCYIIDGAITLRPRPIMLKILPIMLLSSAQKSSLLCSIQSQDYASEPIVLLEYMSIIDFTDCCITVSDCSIRVSRSNFCKL